MPQIIETTVYTLDELSDEAKAKAREWYREGAFDYDWWDCTYEDAKTCAKVIGIEIDKIYFSGFWSQGDGACFEGSYAYAKGGAKVIREHAPQDAELHRIADALQALQRANFYALQASVRQRGRYSHEQCTVIDVSDKDGYAPSAETHDALADLLRDYMRWIYRQLEAEWEYQNADEQVDEAIRANEYTFTEDGARF